MGHHPDLEISWSEVKVSITNHAAGGLTAADFELASRIDELELTAWVSARTSASAPATRSAPAGSTGPTTATGEVACVVLAHGFGGVKEARLDAYAERFAAAGYAALVFDYRHHGDSGGEPRLLIDIGRQHEDWRAAIAHARGLDGVDANRIAAWGTSFSGGHVVELAAADQRARGGDRPGARSSSGIATLRAAGPRRHDPA